MYRSDPYLSFIRTKPCLVCGRKAVAHHEKLKQGGMGIKPPDNQSVPLCTAHHDEQERIGSPAFWDRHNIDVKMAIIRLNTEYLEERGL
jgi:hypothetical protein